MASVTVSRSGERLIAVKQVDAAHAAELEREAELLKRVDHPGVVRFVDLTDAAEGGKALHTEFVSSETWATRPLTDPAERAAGIAALAALVADLHDLGLAHLHITPSHVLHGEDDRPVLCGLTRADESTPENRYADLVALAALCCDESIAKGPLAGRLSSLADAARAGRLSARELARKLDQLLVKRAPGPQSGQRRGIGPFDRLRHAPRGSALLRSGRAASGHRSPGCRSDGEPACPPLSRQAARLQPKDARAKSRPSHQPAAGPPTQQERSASPARRTRQTPDDRDRPGRHSRLTRTPRRRLEPANNNSIRRQAIGSLRARRTASQLHPVDAAAEVEHGGRRYAIGVQGDLVATGDWDCDGIPTPAIVRPATGDVVLFEEWPGPDESLSMPVRWTVETPTGVEVLHDNSCDLLRVLTASGSQLLDPRRMQ